MNRIFAFQVSGTGMFVAIKCPRDGVLFLFGFVFCVFITN